MKQMRVWVGSEGIDAEGFIRTWDVGWVLKSDPDSGKR